MCSKRMLLTYCNWPRLSVLASERLLLLEPRNWVLRKEHGLLLYHSRYRICIPSLHAEISSGCALAWWTIENKVMCSLFILRVGSQLCRRYSEAVQELSICMALAPVHEEAMLQPFVERLHLMRLAVSWGMLSSPNAPSALVWKKHTWWREDFLLQQLLERSCRFEFCHHMLQPVSNWNWRKEY
jgi:hypothetical protein